MNGGANVLYAEFLDKQIRCEITAHRDHQFAQLAKGSGLALRAVEVGGGIVSRIKVEGRAIDKREKLIVDEERIVQGELALMRLMKELDHHRDLHGARGVECVIGLVGPLRFTAQETEENSDIGGRGKDASFDLTFGAGQ
ncbi:hypothetical protein MPRG_13110 [Mycobacterium paragordonae]|uniref:Uncharacterized protein n=1 Tax=Mycobacterium paragordonae TaxID=1389713 RepID=A0ABQ1C149_9MYCO|nr:hypothetical protein MPRG_13110 [Mycobacterium paragordonae]